MKKNTNTQNHTNKNIHIPTTTNAQDDASTNTQHHTKSNKTKYIGLYNIKSEIHRITSATTMNAHSSRSHAIFTVYLQVMLIETKDKM